MDRVMSLGFKKNLDESSEYICCEKLRLNQVNGRPSTVHTTDRIVWL